MLIYTRGVIPPSGLTSTCCAVPHPVGLQEGTSIYKKFPTLHYIPYTLSKHVASSATLPADEQVNSEKKLHCLHDSVL